MKTIKSLLILLFFGNNSNCTCTRSSVKSETNVNFNADKITIISKGAERDANYELTFTAQTKAEEKLLEEQKSEKELKKRIEKRIRPMPARKMFTQHHSHCDSHCHHSDAL
jgi:hypothetical protein